MEQKKMITFCMVVGSGVGAYIPTLFGAGMFSFSSIIFSAIGGFLGIWFGYKISFY